MFYSFAHYVLRDLLIADYFLLYSTRCTPAIKLVPVVSVKCSSIWSKTLIVYINNLIYHNKPCINFLLVEKTYAYVDNYVMEFQVEDRVEGEHNGG